MKEGDIISWIFSGDFYLILRMNTSLTELFVVTRKLQTSYGRWQGPNEGCYSGSGKRAVNRETFRWDFVVISGRQRKKVEMMTSSCSELDFCGSANNKICHPLNPLWHGMRLPSPFRNRNMTVTKGYQGEREGLSFLLLFLSRPFNPFKFVMKRKVKIGTWNWICNCDFFPEWRKLIPELVNWDQPRAVDGGCRLMTTVVSLFATRRSSRLPWLLG